MELEYQANGFLVPGLVEMTQDQILEEFGFTMPRIAIFSNFDSALKIIDGYKDKIVGIFINGSFVSKTPDPGDIDALVLTNCEDTAVDLITSIGVLSMPFLDINFFHKDDPHAAGFLDFYLSINRVKHPTMQGNKGFLRLKYD